MDYKKDFKDLYFPNNEPAIIEVPEMTYFMVKGCGDPNTSLDYKNAMNVLYGLSYTIKMSYKGNDKIDNYYEYKVFPLEGLWWSDKELFKNNRVSDKNKLEWFSIIRQPDFVNEEVYLKALSKLKVKHPEYNYENVFYKKFKEGKCVQIMHYGSYDLEAASIQRMHKFIEDNNYKLDINNVRHHHEIYLSDPRKTNIDKLKTVIRLPIK